MFLKMALSELKANLKSTNTLRTVYDLRYIYLAYYYCCAKKVSLRIVERNYDSDIMVTSNIKATFPTTIENIWEIVTSLTNYSWRSDITKIEIINDIQFREYSKTGFATTFTVTVCKPFERWEFDMENENMKGHWMGIFTPKIGYVEIDFTESVCAKKFLLKPFVKAYLKKQQSIYVQDLEKALANE